MKSLYRWAYDSGILIGDIANMLWPITARPECAVVDAVADATLDDVIARLDDIRNQLHQLHQLSVPPAVSARVVSADPPPAADPPVGGGGHPTSTDNPSLVWSVERPGGGDSTTPPGHPTDRPLSELLRDAAGWIDWAIRRCAPGGDRMILQELNDELRAAANRWAAFDFNP